MDTENSTINEYEITNDFVEKENEEKPKIQYILDENGELVEMLKEDAVPVEYPIKYRLKNAFEVFVRVKNTENYWISNYGRCVNNLNRKDKNTFFRHKDGKCHYTIYEIDIDGSRWKVDTTPEKLVAETFLVQYRFRNRIWHKDSNESNNWYKNLIMVSESDYKNLKAGNVTWQELNLEQGYIEYVNKATASAYRVYSGIRERCSVNSREKTNIHSCYDNTTMCQEWVDNPKSFVKWYLDHYYEVEGESMAVDKDLFGDEASVYSPENCCVLPQGLNTMLANSKKHYEDGDTEDNTLPLGVRYNSKIKKYYGEICFTGTGATYTLSEWDTADEAFAEYKIMKQADICMTAARYRDKIPEYIYKQLLTVDVKPY